MLINKVRIRKNIEILKKALKDPLINFFAEEYAKETRKMQEENFQNLVAMCNEYNIRYICVGFTEIAGCENKRDSEDRFSRPAIWAIAKRLGIDGGCGNSDQYQADMGPWFPYESYGYWNIVDMRKLDPTEITALKFNNVCEKSWVERRYTAPLSYGFELVTLDTLKAYDEKYATV